MVLRAPRPEDFSFYYELKCQPSAIYWGGFADPPEKETLRTHFLRLLHGELPERTLYILEDGDGPAGYLQLTRNSEREVEIGYGVSESCRGRGCGLSILRHAQEIVAGEEGAVDLIGYVRADNIPSKICFEKAGFQSRPDYVERYFAMDDRKVRMFLYHWRRD